MSLGRGQKYPQTRKPHSKCFRQVGGAGLRPSCSLSWGWGNMAFASGTPPPPGPAARVGAAVHPETWGGRGEVSAHDQVGLQGP